MQRSNAEDDVNIINQKFERAKAAQLHWSKLDLEQRTEIIASFQDLLEKNKNDLAQTLSNEVGKPLPESLNEIDGARSRIGFFIENVSKWLRTQEMHTEGNTKEVLDFDPLGVVCNISAWNYPLLVGVNVYVPALLAGNSVLYKPSEYATQTGLAVERLLYEAGLMQDAFISIIGSGEVGEALLGLPCDGYFFTGSYKTGKHIAEKVASRLVPVGLELGGKDPLYVTETSGDLDKVAAAVAEGCFYNNGQSCCAVERVYVHEKVYDSFIEKFVNEANRLNGQLGTVTRPQHMDYLDLQVKDAVEKGARLLTGGRRQNNFYLPTVLVDVNHGMKIMKEETFGPLIGVMKVAGDEEAIELMNDTEYGLTASVFSTDTERAKKILTKVNTGTSYINCCDRVSPYLPWSGRKHSGLGSTLSYLGILTFARPRGWHIRSQGPN